MVQSFKTSLSAANQDGVRWWHSSYPWILFAEARTLYQTIYFRSQFDHHTDLLSTSWGIVWNVGFDKQTKTADPWILFFLAFVGNQMLSMPTIYNNVWQLPRTLHYTWLDSGQFETKAAVKIKVFQCGVENYYSSYSVSSCFGVHPTALQ